MNKIKKVILSIGAFFVGMISKVYAIGENDIIPMYAVGLGPREITGNIISKIGKIAIPFVLFIIGLIVILNKRITKKEKAIIVSILAILAMLGIVLMNYLSTII